MTNTYLVASRRLEQGAHASAPFDYAGPHAGAGGVAVLELAGVRIVADGAQPSRLVELTIDEPDPASGDRADAQPAMLRQLGIEDAPGRATTDPVQHELRIDASRASELSRFAFACDEAERTDNLFAPCWSVDVVVLAHRLGVTASARARAARAHVDRAAAALLGAADRLDAAATDAAAIVARYCTESQARRLLQLVAPATAPTSAPSRADAHADADAVSPALVQRDETRQRVAGALAVHPVAIAAGTHVARLGRLVWQPADARLHVDVDAVAVPDADDDTLWLRAIDADGNVVALAPLVASGTTDRIATHVPRQIGGDLRIGAHNDITALRFEATSDPSSPVITPSAGARAEAVADARAAASASRLGRWPVARDAWLRSARAWARAGDIDRQSLALAEAAFAFDRLGLADEGRGLHDRARELPRVWAVIDERSAVSAVAAEAPFVADTISG